MNASRKRSTPKPTRRPVSRSAIHRALAERSVVIVEDHHDLREILRETLEFAGWKVRTFDQPLAALASIREAPPSVVLTDMNLGTLSGRLLARELRSDATTRSIPIIAMSGSVMPNARLTGLFDLFLFKPLELVTLDRLLRALIQVPPAEA